MDIFLVTLKLFVAELNVIGNMVDVKWLEILHNFVINRRFFGDGISKLKASFSDKYNVSFTKKVTWFVMFKV